MFDLIITGGTVYGNEKLSGRKADIGIVDGKIAALGDLSGKAGQEKYDAEGKLIIPGFVDIHAHSDGIVFFPEESTLRIIQGITTEVSGNCGISLAPVHPAKKVFLEQYLGAALGGRSLDWRWESMDEYFEAVREAGPAFNFTGLVGHGTLRIAVMGFDKRPAGKDELEEMGRLLEQSLDGGAAGMSSGLIYPPGSFSNTEEMIYLCRILADRKKPYTTHMRNESDFVVEALQEALEVARASGVALQVSHHKIAGKHNWGKSRTTLDMIEKARAEGVDVMLDMYPYEAGNTMLSALLPPWVHAGGINAMMERLAQGEVRERIREDILHPDYAWENLSRAASWDKILIAACAEDQFEGKNLEEIGEELKCDPLDAAIELVVRTKNRCSMFLFVMNREDIENILVRDYAMIASDGAITEGAFHPRVLGTFARVLDHYVKRTNILTLEEAVKKMSLLPARRIGLKDRGSIEEGMWADLLVLDWDNFADNTTYAHHHTPATGMDAVFLEGRLTAERGMHRGVFHGSTIKL